MTSPIARQPLLPISQPCRKHTSLGRWRFRYDIIEKIVLLGYCGLRREDAY